MPQFRSPEELEQKYVHEVYNDIAPGFRHMRYKAWPFVEQFLRSQAPGSIIADVGCGSGKYLGLSPSSFVMGSDSCIKLVEIAHERRNEVSVCNNLKLPYKDKCFDAVISVGVIHHLASTKRRLKALQELGRILRPGGKMLVYVWAMEQSHRKFDAQDVLVPYTGHRSKGKKIFHQKSHDSPFLPSQKSPYKNSLRKSRSCDSLFDRSSSKLNNRTDFDNTKKAGKDSIVSSNLEFKALKEIVQTLKNKKDHLIANINSKVMKLYPEKEKSFVNDLVSAVVGRIFDKNNDSDIERCPETQENPNSKGVPNITEFVSSLVKRLFRDKNHQTDPSVDVVNVQPDGKESEVLMKVSEDALKESIYEGLTAWARDKMALLSRDQHGSPLFARGRLLREDSCNSEGSEADTDVESTPAYILSFDHDSLKSELVAETTTSQNGPRMVDSISSSDTDSDGSSSLDLVNSDSGISDTDVPTKKVDADQTSITYPAANNKGTQNKKTTLQRYYHVFSAKELPDLIENGVNAVNVLKEYYDHGNWAVIAEKQ